jgi:hypothetical protein
MMCGCRALTQGPIWQSIKWLDELGMKIIEQVRQQLNAFMQGLVCAWLLALRGV